jgi:hypothetical protein
MGAISRREMLLTTAMALLATHRLRGQQPTRVDVYKDPSCGCCGQWVAHLQRAGFATVVTDVSSIETVKIKYHVPARLQSCHTAIVDGYVIEGHVPASDIRRLLKERPTIVGLAVPGMPVGSPGMEGASGKPYNVVSFDASGRSIVYSTQQPLR